MSPIDDRDDNNTPRFFSKQKTEMDDILSDIDSDLSDDVLDIDDYNEPLVAPIKSGAKSKSAFGFGKKYSGIGDAEFLGSKKSLSKSSSKSLLLLGSALGLIALAGGSYFVFVGGDTSLPAKTLAPLTPALPMADATMPAPPETPETIVTPAMDQAITPPEITSDIMPSNDLPVVPNVSTETPSPSASTATLPSTPDGLPTIPSDPAALPEISKIDSTKAESPDTSIPAPPTVPTLPEAVKSPEQISAESKEIVNATDSNIPQLPNAPLVQPEEKVTDVKPNVAEENLLKALNEPVKKPPSQTETLKSESKTEIATKAAKKAGPIKYFDAPSGEILEDIQPPSIDVSRNPGESIIIVQKPVGYDNSYRGGDETIKIERSGATDIMSNRAISADRAMRLGRYDVALDFYNEILSQNPNDINALLGRAIAWQRMGQDTAAENAYRDVLRRDQSNVTAATNLASIQSKQSPERAMKNLSKVYQDNPNDSSVKGQLGVSMAQSGDVEQAYQSFLSATQNDPKNPQHFFNLAVTAEKLSKKSEAIAAYEKCLEVDAIYGTGRGINRDVIYDRLAKLRGQ